MSFFSFIKKFKLFDDEPTVKFKSIIGNYAVATPVVSASTIRPEWNKKEREKKLQFCPGMWDYAAAGYLVTAPFDITIKSNSEGTIVIIGECPDKQYFQARPFDHQIVDGLAKIDSSAKPATFKVPMPWMIQTKKGYSAYVLPPLLHCDFFDKIHVYPGVVDYDNFYTCNFVFSALKECEFTIKTGTPLIHVIPFKREVQTAVCDRATIKEIDDHRYTMAGRKHYYRKFLARKKVYKMSCPYEHRLPVSERKDEDK